MMQPRNYKLCYGEKNLRRKLEDMWVDSQTPLGLGLLDHYYLVLHSFKRKQLIYLLPS